jgi:hypothetical protein
MEVSDALILLEGEANQEQYPRCGVFAGYKKVQSLSSGQIPIASPLLFSKPTEC